MTVTFTKATRRQQKLKIAITGPSGSGKSLGALRIAEALAPTGKIAAIDSENGSLSLYSDECAFDTIQIGPPYLTSKYLEAIDAAVAAGYEVLIVDSITHQWDGDGGILQRKEQADAVPGSNHFANWEPFTKEYNAFRAKLLNAPIHLIATMRSKQAYQLKEGEGGGRKGGRVEKLGLQPIQREGMEYEYTVTFDLAMDHKASASKDRTKLFDGQRHDLLKGNIGQKLAAWLETAAPELPPAPAPVQAPAPAQPSAPAVARPAPSSNGSAANGNSMSAAQLNFLNAGQMPIGHNKGRAITALSNDDILGALTWIRENNPQKFAPLVRALEQEFNGRPREPREPTPAQQPFDEMPAALEKGGKDDDLPF